MADTFTTTTRQSYGSRLGNSIKGVFVGLILVAIGVILLFWNEGRAVKRAKTLKEGAGLVVAAQAAAVDAANEGKLVHVAGNATAEGELEDPTFGVRSPALRLHREVEMYQWKEESKSEEKKNMGGSTETVTTYTYSKTWDDDHIDSSDFKQPGGHQNPGALPVESATFDSSSIRLGAYRLSDELVHEMDSFTPLTVTADHKVPESTLTTNCKVVVGGLYLGNNPDSPEVGDLRVQFSVVLPGEFSVVAGQMQDSLISYQTKVGGMLALLEPGLVPAATMFSKAASENNMISWILRALGTLLLFIGFASILKPLSVVADVLPILGNIVGAGTGFVAFLLALAVALIVIAVAWFFFRPIAAVVLAGVAVGLVVLIRKKGKKSPA